MMRDFGEKTITVEEFTDMLLGAVMAGSVPETSDVPETEDGDCARNCAGDVMTRAGQLGIIEEYEILHRKDTPDKRTAARILHRTLRMVLHESDEADWNGACRLRDLFDCHACVGDIAQVYVKGIMEPKDDSVFGIHEPVSRVQAQRYIDRLIHKEKRLKGHVTPVNPGKKTLTLREYKEISESGPETAPACGTDEAGTAAAAEVNAAATGTAARLCIDLRSREEYMNDPKIPGCENIPFKKIYLNPCIASEDRYAGICLYSDNEYESEAAADLLVKHGYADVTVIRPDAVGKKESVNE